ncbi:hypothetical protein Tco_1509976 [Tanacetum coccineum]
MVAYLQKPEGSEAFHQIVDFLNTSHIKYALIENPKIYISLIQQFWGTATARTTDDGEVEITASIDGQVKTITEASLRRHLKLEDSDGITSLPNTEIFEQLALMGYVSDSDRLTFQKGHFSPQWRFFIHTILHCLSPKTTAWEQFSSNIATAIICLATNRTFNFSKMIFDAMVKNLDSTHKFLMYPRFLQICLNKQKRLLQPHTRTYLAHTLTKKLFSNMKRASRGYSGVDFPLFPTMITTPESSPSRITSSPSLSPQTYQSPQSSPLRDITRQDAEIPQSQFPTQTQVADEAAFTSVDVDAGGAATTDIGLEAGQGSGTMHKTPTRPHDSPLLRVHTLGSDEGSLQQNELMDLVTKLTDRVEVLENDLQQTKKVYSSALTKLIMRVKKLEHRVKTRQPRRRARVIISDTEEDLEDPSKQGRRIAEIDQNPSISLVQDEGTSWIQEDAEIQGKTSADTEILLDQEEPTELVEDLGSVIAEADQAHDIDWSDPAVLRYHALQNRSFSVAEVRKNMCMYLKNQGGYKQSHFKGMSYEDIRPIFEKSSKKRSREDSDEDNAKKQKLEDDAEKEELRDSMDVVPRDDIAIDIESLATKYPIVDWKTHVLTENMMYYQIIRADGSSKITKYSVKCLMILIGKMYWIYKDWYKKEKKYPLTQEMLSRMLSRRLEVDQESEMAFELLRGGLSGIKFIRLSTAKSKCKYCLSHNWQYKPVITARRILVLLGHRLSLYLISSIREDSVGLYWTSYPVGTILPSIPSTPVASSALRRRVMVLAPRQPIPHGRPYRYHLNGPVHMMTARKRVGPLPTHHLATSSDSSADALSDSASSRSSSDHSLPTPSSGRKILKSPWGSPIPIGYGDGDVNRFPDGDGDGDRDEAEKQGWGCIPRLSAAISDRPSHDSSFASPSRKRSRSPAASVPLSLPIPRALSYARADLLPSPKRIRSSKFAMDLEVSSAEDSEPSRYKGTDLEMDVDVEIETGVRGPVEVKFDRVTHPVIADDIPEPTQEGAVEVTYETLRDLVQRFHDHTKEIPVHRVQAIESLEWDNMRLRDMMDVMSQRVARTMPNTRSRASRTRKGINKQIDLPKKPDTDTEKGSSRGHKVSKVKEVESEEWRRLLLHQISDILLSSRIKIRHYAMLDLRLGVGWTRRVLRRKPVKLQVDNLVMLKLELPQELSRVHNTFHVSNLRKYYADEPLAVPLDELHFDEKLRFVEKPAEIMDREVKRLRQSRVLIVKVRWNSRRGPEFT